MTVEVLTSLNNTEQPTKAEQLQVQQEQQHSLELFPQLNPALIQLTELKKWTRWKSTKALTESPLLRWICISNLASRLNHDDHQSTRRKRKLSSEHFCFFPLVFSYISHKSNESRTAALFGDLQSFCKLSQLTLILMRT